MGPTVFDSVSIRRHLGLERDYEDRSMFDGSFVLRGRWSLMRKFWLCIDAATSKNPTGPLRGEQFLEWS